MVQIDVTRADLASSRFAISPLWELTSVLRRFNAPESDPMLRPWLERHRENYRSLCEQVDIEAVLALQTPRYGVDFLSPPPTDAITTIDELIDVVRSTTTRQSHTEIEKALAGKPRVSPRIASVLQNDDVVDYLADVLSVAWQKLLGPEWPKIRAILDRDIVHRSGRLVSRGWAEALADLHPHLRWRENVLEFDRWPDQHIKLRGRGLMLIPSVFNWPSFSLVSDEPWPPALIYPARGIAALLHPPQTQTETAIARLIGSARAAILAALDEPTTTSQLAATLDQSLGAVSEHLTILRGAGLVDRARSGRSMLYQRTPTGETLLTANSSD